MCFDRNNSQVEVQRIMSMTLITGMTSWGPQLYCAAIHCQQQQQHHRLQWRRWVAHRLPTHLHYFIPQIMQWKEWLTLTHRSTPQVSPSLLWPLGCLMRSHHTWGPHNGPLICSLLPSLSPSSIQWLPSSSPHVVKCKQSTHPHDTLQRQPIGQTAPMPSSAG